MLIVLMSKISPSRAKMAHFTPKCVILFALARFAILTVIVRMSPIFAIFVQLSSNDMETRHMAIFASGNGSNAENLIHYFNSRDIGWKVAVVVCNKPDAGVLDRARRLGVPSVVMPKLLFSQQQALAKVMDDYAIDAVVLAGFLLMIPSWLIARYPQRIINIHPSLLPKYGGRGMYGRHVHEAVVAAGETESGITIHLVNEDVDGGRILFQAKTPVTPTDTPADLETKIHRLEQQYFPQVVASTLTTTSTIPIPLPE